MTIIIYGKFGCSACETAKRLLAKRGINYEYKDMKDLNDNDTASLLSNAASAGVRSLPIIISNGEVASLQEVLQ